MDVHGTLAAVLSPIARTMIRGELGVGTLVLAAKISYLQAAIDEVLPKGRRANVSRLSVVTGMTRKEVASLLRSAKGKNLVKDGRRPLEQRALRVLRGWTTDPLFKSGSGRPAELEMRGSARTFSTLVRAYGGDVTPAAVLQELQRLNAVHRSPSGKLRVRIRSLKAHARPSEQIREFALLLRDFVDTASQLVRPVDPPQYLGFRDTVVSDPVEAALFQRTFSRRAALLLEGVERWRDRQRGLTNRAKRPADSSKSVGMGIYLTQRDHETDRQRRMRVKSR